ncbi:PRC-barrel domain-containing protein [Streptomyces sp. NBC_01198]|uniref:PRC-barrel domain-containing protein n=1 Tax=Streptomyces sp. NBC_01198 TaxID=2903769 RepID=UPI002E0E32C4|nr:PRC-barrel domain-containing protein [Streptomyces sp. NBC_01198]
MTEDVFADPEALRRLTAYGRDGRPIGAVSDVYVDDMGRRPEWVTVRTVEHGEGSGDTFVPLEGATHTREGVLDLACTTEAVRTAPRMEAEQHLDLVQEQELYLHYGLSTPAQEASGAPGVGGRRPKTPVFEGETDLEEVKELADEPPAPAAAPTPRLRKYEPGTSGPGRAADTPAAGGAHRASGAEEGEGRD